MIKTYTFKNPSRISDPFFSIVYSLLEGVTEGSII